MRLTRFYYLLLKNSYDWDISEQDIIDACDDPLFKNFHSEEKIITAINLQLVDFFKMKENDYTSIINGDGSFTLKSKDKEKQLQVTLSEKIFTIENNTDEEDYNKAFEDFLEEKYGIVPIRFEGNNV